LSTYNEFSIQEIIPDLSQKRVIIKTNFKVDPNSVTEHTVALYNYDKASLAIYQTKVDGKNIYLEMEDFPENDSRYYLKVQFIKDALGRQLKVSFDDYIIFTTELISKVRIIAPISRETLKSRNITIRLAVDNYVSGTKCRIQIASDNIFYNKILELEQIIEGEEIIVNTTIEREGQVYLRARAEQNDQVFGDWSELISFNIYTIEMDSIQTSFLEEYLTSNDLFDDNSIIVLEDPEVKRKSPSATNEGMFFIEFDKEIKLPDLPTLTIEPPVLGEYEYDENGYIIINKVVGFRKNLDGTGRKEKITFNLVVDEDDLETVFLFPENNGPLLGEVLDDSIYEIIIKNLQFQDGSVYSNKESFITKPMSNYFVPLDDVKEIAGKLQTPDEEILRNIIEAGRTAVYWAKRKVENKNDIPDFNNVNLVEDYYPFYMFIKYHAIAESLKARLVELVTNPQKWHDVLSDLERSEEWDFDALKDLINDYEKEAEEWLELIVTITADPKWALRGKYCYSTFYTNSNPYHRIQWGQPPHNSNYNRGY
jgi:hypothetical protein